MTELIVKLRKCAEELSQIADAMARQVAKSAAVDQEEVERRLGDDVKRIVDVFREHGVDAKTEKIHQGPTVNMIELSIPCGCRYGEVTRLEDEMQIALMTSPLRIVAPLPGRETVGVEYHRADPENVSFEETVITELRRLDSQRARPSVPVVVGKDVDNDTVSFDLTTLPHLLIGGEIGRDETMLIHSMINGFVSSRSPEELRMIIFDSSGKEYAAYANLPHLLMPLINENREAIKALQWAVSEMERRLKIFTRAQVRNIQDFNRREIVEGQDESFPETLPYIVIVLDDLSDLMVECSRAIVPCISRLSAKARAVGIHLVMATRHPDEKVVSGSIKVNIPGRIAFKMNTSLNSLIVLDDDGAERLVGNGDCLYKGNNGLVQRVQTPYIPAAEIASNVEMAIKKYAPREYSLTVPHSSYCAIDPFDDDESCDSVEFDKFVEMAIDVIRETNRASIAHLQRNLGLGYEKASRVIDELEKRGIVGPARGGASREIFIDD